MPVGPFKLSTHPGNGSFHEAVTIDGRMITIGKSVAISDNTFSAHTLVKMYVLGKVPRMSSVLSTPFFLASSYTAINSSGERESYFHPELPLLLQPEVHGDEAAAEAARAEELH